MNLYKLYIFIAAILFIVPETFVKAEFEEITREKNKEEQSSDNESFRQDSLQEEDDEQLLLDDEKLKQEIFDIILISYKDIIDLSALYFCGLIDSDKLCDQVKTLLHKDLFKVLKLFSWYIPAVIKNKKVSTSIKIKKSIGIAALLVLFWYSSKEVLHTNRLNKGFDFDTDDIPISPRQRPSRNL